MLAMEYLLAPSVLISCITLGCSCSPVKPDFSGLWQLADKALVIRPDVNAMLEEYTLEARANIRDYVVDITQSANRIIVLVEFLDNHRVIHVDATQVPENVTPTNNGYSWANWEGDSLVIETAALKARSPVGLMQRTKSLSEPPPARSSMSMPAPMRFGTIMWPR
jgi:hypothetical protein